MNLSPASAENAPIHKRSILGAPGTCRGRALLSGGPTPLPSTCWSLLCLLCLDIGHAHTAALVGEGTDGARPVALHCFDRRRGMGHFMQLELGQFDIVDVPGLGIQLLAPDRIERLF